MKSKLIGRADWLFPDTGTGCVGGLGGGKSVKGIKVFFKIFRRGNHN